jgi:hypothetical protein
MPKIKRYFFATFCVKILFCRRYFSLLNTFNRNGKDTEPEPEPDPHLTGSGRPKNMRIRYRIRIPNITSKGKNNCYIFIWTKPDLLHVSRYQHADNLVPTKKIVYLTAACSLANIY